jgi:hypothetical protein
VGVLVCGFVGVSVGVDVWVWVWVWVWVCGCVCEAHAVHVSREGLAVYFIYITFALTNTERGRETRKT